MTEIKVIEPGCKIWTDAIEFAKNCSWRAGAYLAHKMEVNDFDENEHVHLHFVIIVLQLFVHIPIFSCCL